MVKAITETHCLPLTIRSDTEPLSSLTHELLYALSIIFLFELFSGDPTLTAADRDMTLNMNI